jgi:hypothetical protein
LKTMYVPVAASDGDIGLIVIKTRCRLDPRDFLFQRGCCWWQHPASVPFVHGTDKLFRSHMIDALLVGVKVVKTELIMADKEDNDARTYAQGKPGDINDGERFVADDIPPGDQEIVFEHGTIFLSATTNLIS